eukprot:gnl/TRDRNA2_/TRDRNA2_170279_c0_seq1.p1 gnl/TRDRNA2_/TRDRNA2_170279_c0~~gnl/TRDRNA2_/TRDRNA2_170279_c0_seq1.p1  ORF type:complete len:451 (+),score=64.71 gnl/TRDRNA2_/TRDRNA2_170279_c0_seq1:155-1354(+)
MDVDDGRHFRNTLDDRSSPPGWEKAVRKVLPEAIQEICAGEHAKPSVYTGEGGVAFALLHLARRGHQVPESSALPRLEAGERRFDSRRVTLLEGRPGNIALQVCARWRSGQRAEAAALVSRLASLADTARRLSPGECEVLYGRCGFLGALLLVRRELAGDECGRPIAEPAAVLVREIVAAGKQNSRRGWPLYYEWHDKCYFGGAHGMAGILLTLLQLPAELEAADPNAFALVRSTADRLLEQRFRSGNIPSSDGNQKDKCVHWCHGAPGFVPLLIRLAEVYDEPRYLALAREMGDVVWMRGLLSEKGLGLCHGIPGNGYALLCLHRATQDNLWLRRAQHFAAFAVEKKRELAPLADRPFSLFEGLAGAVCFWVDVLHATFISADRGSAADKVLFPCYEF